MNKQPTQYSVLIKYIGGHTSYLSHRNRMEWTIHTARKHAKDCTAKIVSGQWPDVRYVAVVMN